MADNTAKLQRRGPGRPFQSGESGNPSGRPKGARDRALLALEALLEGEAQAITQKLIGMALAGDPTGIRLVMERIFPAPKERAITLELSRSATPRKAADSIIRAVVQGEITPGEGHALMALVEAKARLVDLEAMKIELSELREMLEQWRADREGHQR